MKKNWFYKRADPLKVKEISSVLGISPFLATLLVHRNVTDIHEAGRFIFSDISSLPNPFLLPDMEKAVMRVRQAIDAKEKILIYGDRDVDGVTSLAILVRTLKNLGAEILWAVPLKEGYGLQNSILERFRKQGVSLVITVDCGTKAVQEIQFACSIGLDVIVTDHHLQGAVLPPAFAIVNPSLKNSKYPAKDLAGCLTAFKFAYALMVTFNRTFNQEYVILDLETTGLSSLSDEIVEIGALLVKNFVPVKKFHSLIRTSRPIPPSATQIHGITDAMVQEAPSLAEVLPDLARWIGRRTIVAHNARFDMGFLNAAYEKILGQSFDNTSIDTLALSREIFQLPSHSLTALVKELRIESVNTHRAMADCMATLSLFQKIEEKGDPRLQFFVEDQMDLVTLGTIADVVPLLHENRTVVRYGLGRLLNSRKVGLRALMESCGIKSGSVKGQEQPPTAKEIAWGVTPLLNAAGRFSKADLTALLLLTEDEAEAKRLVREISGLNQDRKSLQKINMNEFFKLVQEQCDLTKDKLVFVVAQGLEHGVTGIVASQMVREFARPVVLLIVENGTARGSSRSIPSFNIVNALTRCEGLLTQYGGHPAAAGLTLESKNIEMLKEQIKKIAQEEIDRMDLIPKIEIDLELELNQLNLDFIQEMRQLEPYGQGNPEPVFFRSGDQNRGRFPRGS